jgi:membrane-associated protease RseP (regulator of RpoE activity)
MDYEDFLDDAASNDRRLLFPHDSVVILAEAVPVRESAPTTHARRPRVWLPLLLFAATCLSTLLVGGWIYAVAVMTILGCHEAGHYVQTRRYGVRASLPFFLPMPFSPIGTLGAVIGMDARISSRKALFDIGITGPLAGLVPTLICCVVGLQLSEVHRSMPGALEFGEPLLFKALGWLTFGPIPPGYDVYLHPLGMAGWVGLLITALNLFPIGQLDGGHILYGLLRSKARYVATLVLFAVIAAIVVLGYWWWSVMVFLLILMGPEHPPTADDHVRLGPVRVALGWLTLCFMPLGFTPIPIS